MNDIIKPFGLWQVLVMSMGVFSLVAFEEISVFLKGTPRKRCRMEEAFEAKFGNLSIEEINLFIQSNETDYEDFRGCVRFLYDWENFELNRSIIPQDAELEKCPLGYVMESNPMQMKMTATEDMQLFCGEEWVSSAVISFYMLGMLLGFYSAGYAGDKFGRKPCFIVSSIIHTCGGLLLTFAPNKWAYLISQIFIGMGGTVKMTMLCLIVFEITTANWRPFCTCLWTMLASIVNRMSLILIAYLTQHWRYLSGGATLLTCLAYISILILPESPRWYASRQRSDDVLRVLIRGYRWNHWGKRPSEDAENAIRSRIEEELARQNSDTRVKQHLIQMLKNGQLRKVTFFGSILFTCHVTSYFGLLLYPGEIKANVFLAAFFNCCFSMPGTFLAMFLYSRFRYRKRPLMGVFMVAMCFCTIGILIKAAIKPDNEIWLAIIIGGAFSMLEAAMDMLYTYILELYPTSFRAKGLGFTSGFARFGAALCSFINSLDSISFSGTALVVYLLILSCACISLLFLPDTDGVNVPDVIESITKQEKSIPLSTM
ncbi:hypothetical protein Ciccas_003406 [Cichlidogyrus casuarinus]|uniref:Major facilitator superfamily (MFS) profile domain-containing protein n=1 Tax=Cichlidogyrus casuarinus TaxID=1844966 RepID=A0ABD2QEP0_9PLAT